MILKTLLASVRACVRQVPKPDWAGMTQSPFWKPVEGEPVERTSKTPSFPGTAAAGWVPRSVVKGGFAP